MREERSNLMTRMLVLYGTTEGQTARIARRLAETLRKEGCEVDVVDSRHLPAGFSMRGYDAALIGASIHAGGFQHAVRDFVEEHLADLQRIPAAFFSVSLTEAYPPGTHLPERAELHEHVSRFLGQTGWQPQRIVGFAGALAYSRYGFFKRLVMKSIARQAGMPRDTSRDYEYTDWIGVAHFGKEFAAALKALPASAAT
jgi:menaquinone-dependent protoporphyrinogen oxidase